MLPHRNSTVLPPFRNSLSAKNCLLLFIFVARIFSSLFLSIMAYTGAIIAMMLAMSAITQAAIPWGQTFTGELTYYDDAGYGACGTQINAATQNLVAISHQWFTTANPNKDPVCKNVCVKVNYQGKSVTVPVKDKCPSCSKTHLDLSKTAFQKLANTSVGRLRGATFSFVQC